MRSSPSWIRRCLSVALVLAVIALVRRKRLAPGGVDAGGLFPPIGGDTWPPVPVKGADLV
ncbi:MAG: hypothetical protein ABSB09_10265 [Acidimicrobiales bacterium]